MSRHILSLTFNRQCQTSVSWYFSEASSHFTRPHTSQYLTTPHTSQDLTPHKTSQAHLCSQANKASGAKYVTCHQHKYVTCHQHKTACVLEQTKPATLSLSRATNTNASHQVHLLYQIRQKNCEKTFCSKKIDQSSHFFSFSSFLLLCIRCSRGES